jgi:signal transduction histidine kinase
VMLALLVLIAAGLLEELLPRRLVERNLRAFTIDDRRAASAGDSVSIDIDARGLRIRSPRPAASAAPAAASQPGTIVGIQLPPGLSKHAREAIDDAVGEVRQAVDEAVAEDRAERGGAAVELASQGGTVALVPKRAAPDWPTDLALLWVVASTLIKITYKGRIQAEAQAARATETAEAEALKRQVVEARMAAMQAQVEPHFLFNTLASIDHLIETDAPRASKMQKNLIALLRASMPSLREAGSGGPRSLGRELDLVRPYLEILKMRMDERLHTLVDIPEGLLSAEFPAMMLQSLVENAIKHGLEPKPEGGSLTLGARVVHGKLSLSVADTGLGFGRATTGGTGVGLANIRERLALLYGGKATLVVADNPGGGTLATITVPYRSLEEHSA